MRNEVYCKFIAHNICCVLISQMELGIEPMFWDEQATEKTVIEMPPMPTPVANEAPAITASVTEEKKPMAFERVQVCAGA
jgi:hypothetical protein